MKLTKNSKDLMLFFTKNKHINTVKQTNRTNDILSELYNDIYDSYMFVNGLKRDVYYTITTKKIMRLPKTRCPIVCLNRKPLNLLANWRP